jgi:N-ethylmaleimide reductase
MAKAQAALTTGIAEMVSFGVPFLANPDLPERYRRQQEQPETLGGRWHEPCTAPLNAPDPATFYGEGPHGYTDYPTLAQSKAAAPWA